MHEGSVSNTPTARCLHRIGQSISSLTGPTWPPQSDFTNTRADGKLINNSLGEKGEHAFYFTIALKLQTFASQLLDEHLIGRLIQISPGLCIALKVQNISKYLLATNPAGTGQEQNLHCVPSKLNTEGKVMHVHGWPDLRPLLVDRYPDDDTAFHQLRSYSPGELGPASGFPMKLDPRTCSHAEIVAIAHRPVEHKGRRDEGRPARLVYQAQRWNPLTDASRLYPVQSRPRKTAMVNLQSTSGPEPIKP